MTQGRPLSAGQQALWFVHRMAPDSPAYNVVLAVRVRTALDTGRLQAAARALAVRHDMIRSSFTEIGGEPRRLPGDPDVIRVEIRDVAGQDLTQERIAAACRRPFRLADGEPPCRLLLLRCAPDDAVLAIVAHHIATDAASQWLLLTDLLDAYQEDGGGGKAPAGSYDAHVEDERLFLASPERTRHAGFWRQACDGAVAAELPADRDRPPRQTFDGATFKLALPDGLASRVRAAAASGAVTPFGFLLGTFMALLHLNTGQDDLTVGCAVNARRGRAMREVVGYLVNPVVVRVRLGACHTFADAARLAYEATMAGVRHARYPFPVLVKDLDVPRLADRTPLFQITFTMIEATPFVPLSRLLPTTSAQGPECEYAGLRLALLDIPHVEGPFDLSVEVRQRDQSLAIIFRYNTDLFADAAIERLAGHYARIVEIAADNPGTRIADANLMDSAELGKLLRLGTGGSVTDA